MTDPIDLEALRAAMLATLDVEIEAFPGTKAMIDFALPGRAEAYAHHLAALIDFRASTESLIAELTTRRARDAEVEALVAACRLARSYMSEAIEYETPCAKRDGATVDAALLPFQRSDDKGDAT